MGDWRVGRGGVEGERTQIGVGEECETLRLGVRRVDLGRMDECGERYGSKRVLEVWSDGLTE